MKDIVILVNQVVGSVLSLCSEIKRSQKISTHVICVNSNYKPIFFCSKYVDKVKQMEVANGADLLFQIQKWYDEQSFVEEPILYFTDDYNCNLVNEKRSWYEQHFIVCLPSDFIVRTFTHKGLAEKEALRCGLSVPKTEVIEKEIDLDKILKKFNFPVIIKPRSSDMTMGLNFKKAKILYQEEFIDFTIPIIKNGATFLCQEYIPGSDDKTFFYLFYRDVKGRIVENMGIKLLQSPPGQGIMAVGKNRYNSKVAHISRDFLEKIDYVGIGGIEYKEFEGHYFFIEMNTRIEAILRLADVSGVNISNVSYRSLSGLTVDYNSCIQSDNFIYFDLPPFLKARWGQKKYIKMMVEFMKALFKKNIKFNILSIYDPLPFWINVIVVFNNKIMHRGK